MTSTQLHPPRDAIVRHLFETFRATFGGAADEVTPKEQAEAD
jgi:hypothetical protein